MYFTNYFSCRMECGSYTEIQGSLCLLQMLTASRRFSPCPGVRETRGRWMSEKVARQRSDIPRVGWECCGGGLERRLDSGHSGHWIFRDISGWHEGYPSRYKVDPSPWLEGPLQCWHHAGERPLVSTEAGLGTWNTVQTDLKKMNTKAPCVCDSRALWNPQPISGRGMERKSTQMWPVWLFLFVMKEKHSFSLPPSPPLAGLKAESPWPPSVTWASPEQRQAWRLSPIPRPHTSLRPLPETHCPSVLHFLSSS